jgi:hypothetical protein
MAEPYSFTPSNLTHAPQPVGGVICTARDAAPGARDVAEGNVTTHCTNEDGALYVLPYSPQIWKYSLSSATQQTNTAVHAAPGSGLSIYLTDIFYAAGGAVTLILEDGDATFLWGYPAAASGDGAKDSRITPIKLTANKALQLDTSAAVQVYVTITGYIAP